MATWRVCLFSLVAICYIGGCAAFPVDIPSEEPSTEAPVSFDYHAEKRLGKYTGPWDPNTRTSFERVLALIEYSYQTGTERLVKYVDEMTEDERIAVEKNPLNMTTLTYRNIQYARDYRKMETQELGDSRYYYMEIKDPSAKVDEPKYPFNKEVVWQIEIPEHHVAFVALTSISLEKPTGGSCINDFVSVYTDDEVPDKFCSTLEQIRQFKPVGSERLTVKFQSNEANNSGGFAGAVWILHNSIFSSQKRRRRDVSLAEEPIAVAEEERSEELKGNDMDLPEVEEAITCLVHIAKYGEWAADQYRSSPNANCREMAEAFIDSKYVHL